MFCFSFTFLTLLSSFNWTLALRRSDVPVVELPAADGGSAPRRPRACLQYSDSLWRFVNGSETRSGKGGAWLLLIGPHFPRSIGVSLACGRVVDSRFLIGRDDRTQHHNITGRQAVRRGTGGAAGAWVGGGWGDGASACQLTDTSEGVRCIRPASFTLRRLSVCFPESSEPLGVCVSACLKGGGVRSLSEGHGGGRSCRKTLRFLQRVMFAFLTRYP